LSDRRITAPTYRIGQGSGRFGEKSVNIAMTRSGGTVVGKSNETLGISPSSLLDER